MCFTRLAGLMPCFHVKFLLHLYETAGYPDLPRDLSIMASPPPHINTKRGMSLVSPLQEGHVG